MIQIKTGHVSYRKLVTGPKSLLQILHTTPLVDTKNSDISQSRHSEPQLDQQNVLLSVGDQNLCDHFSDQPSRREVSQIGEKFLRDNQRAFLRSIRREFTQRLCIFAKFHPAILLLSRTLLRSRRYRCRCDGGGGGKYIMPLVKLSFYDHFMVARGPSMLSTYRCVLLTAELEARADTLRISFIICVSRTL